MKKYRVIDPIFHYFPYYMKELYLDSIRTYVNRKGEVMRTYKLKEKESDVFCIYFGEKQIELINE